jgi:hypothetical protein
MLRLVFGLGTRAVDRTVGDYAKIVCLDDPLRIPPINFEDQKKYSQHSVDIISIKENTLVTKNIEDIFSLDIKADKELFASLDIKTADRLRELGYKNRSVPYIFDFQKLLKNTEFPIIMRDMLSLLSKVYDYPVDIEFTANFIKDNYFKINLLQCRPLQTKGLGKPIEIPKLTNLKDCFFSTKGNFMGGNVRLPIDFVVFIHAHAYLKLNEQGKYAVARQIGIINTELKEKKRYDYGSGEMGNNNTVFRVSLHFSELCNMSVICEMSSPRRALCPNYLTEVIFFRILLKQEYFMLLFLTGKKMLY